MGGVLFVFAVGALVFLLIPQLLHYRRPRHDRADRGGNEYGRGACEDGVLEPQESAVESSVDSGSGGDCGDSSDGGGCASGD
jgi:hypothetical protein